MPALGGGDHFPDDPANGVYPLHAPSARSSPSRRRRMRPALLRVRTNVILEPSIVTRPSVTFWRPRGGCGACWATHRTPLYRSWRRRDVPGSVENALNGRLNSKVSVIRSRAIVCAKGKGDRWRGSPFRSLGDFRLGWNSIRRFPYPPRLKPFSPTWPSDRGKPILGTSSQLSSGGPLMMSTLVATSGARCSIFDRPFAG